MELARQEYPALLPGLDPQQAVDILDGRVALINKIHADIADWLQERRRIEDQYAQSLRKLARRPQQDNAAALGVFQLPWQRIVGATETMAQSHETFSAKIQADVETPLRQFSSTNREAQSMSNVSGNLAAIAKELHSAQKKAQKLDAKGGNKAEDARSNVDDATLQWESQAPFVFEQLQALDEGRVNHLRDVLTQFQTHELDQVERSRATAESCLNALLNVETADEIKTFAMRAKGQAIAPVRQDSLVGSSSLRPSGSIPPVPPPPRTANAEYRNSSLPSQDRVAPLPEPPKEKKLSGLKRFGTVMSRRKNAAPPPVPAEKKKEKSRSSFAPFRRQESSRSFNDLESTGQDLTPQRSRDDRASSRHDDFPPPRTQESLASDSPAPTLNGTSSAQQPRIDTSVPPNLPPLTANQAPLIPQSSTLSPISAVPASSVYSPDRTSRVDPFAQAQADTPTSPEDSARNFEIKDQPIPEDAGAAQAAMNDMANQLRMQAQSSGMNRIQGSVRGRRDVRNTVFVPNSNQELSSASATPTLGLSTPTSPATYNTQATSATMDSPGVMSPVKRSLGTGMIPEDGSLLSDSHSIHSAHSAAGMAHHHDMTTPGLNASIVETVNSWFSDSGVTRSFVIGEVALAYNHSGATSDRELVRLQNYQQLEKCAQNPVFVTPSTSEDSQPGTYDVALSSISRSTPTVAFKYQLHLSDSNLSAYSPLLINQAWQIIEGQANVIFLYSLNPAFSSIANPGSSPVSGPQELKLKNVSFTISLDTKPSTSTDIQPAPKAVGAQMMPVQNASFKKRSSAVVWRFPELTITPTQERLLVRFAVENNGMAKRGGVEVKFEAPNTLGSALGVERFVTGAAEAAADPFADEDGAGSDGARRSAEQGGRWEDVTSRKVLVSGKYSASEQ